MTDDNNVTANAQRLADELTACGADEVRYVSTVLDALASTGLTLVPDDDAAVEALYLGLIE